MARANHDFSLTDAAHQYDLADSYTVFGSKALDAVRDFVTVFKPDDKNPANPSTGRFQIYLRIKRYAPL
jgi:hypothetical protein